MGNTSSKDAYTRRSIGHSEVQGVGAWRQVVTSWRLHQDDTVCHHGCRLGLERSYAGFDYRRRFTVVGGAPHEVRPSTACDSQTVVVNDADVGGIAVITHPCIASGIRLTDRTGVVRGGVVT